MHSVPRVLFIASFAVAVAAPASAAGITISDAWFRALPGGLPAGGYFSVHNAGTAPVALTGAASPACGMLMLHQSTESGGVSRMNDVQSVTVPAGGSISFAPAGYHLMCMNPTAAMTPGKSIAVTFTFANGTRTDATFAVRNATGK